MRHYLGIDIGTFESKGVLTDGAGTILASAARPHKMLVPQPGYAEHRPREDWWGDFTAISRELIEKTGVAPAAIRAVGTSAIGPCMLPVDGDGEALMNGVLYGVDARAAQEIEELTAEIGNDVLLERCGNALTTQSVGPKILWLKRNRPEIYAKARKIVTSTTYIVQHLTGRCVIDHFSAANWSPLYSAETRSWTDEFAGGIISTGRLPDLLWTTDIAGTVTARAAAETGLAQGTPVIAGTIDAAAEALSVGVRKPSDMMIMYGSTIFIILLTPERVRDSRLWYAPWLFPDCHALMSGLATSGTLTHWFRDQFARELDPKQAMITLAEEAAGSPPGAKGLLVLPYFSGERTPIHDPLAKGMIFGLDLTHSRADVYRAFLEGIAHGTAHIAETYRALGQEPGLVAAVGGGTKNRVWSQAVSDIAGLSQLLREKTMGASFGDAFLAAHALGDVALDDIEQWNRKAGELVPDAARAELYARQFAIFKTLYERTSDLMHRTAG